MGLTFKGIVDFCPVFITMLPGLGGGGLSGKNLLPPSLSMSVQFEEEGLLNNLRVTHVDLTKPVPEDFVYFILTLNTCCSLMLANAFKLIYNTGQWLGVERDLNV